MFEIFSFLLFLSASDECPNGQTKPTGPTYEISNCFFDGTGGETAWGSCIYYIAADASNTNTLKVTSTTFLSPYGARGVVLFTENVQSTLQSICCTGARMNKDNQGNGYGSFYSSEGNSELMLSQASIVSGDSSCAGFDLTIDLNKAPGELNTCNISNIAQKYNIIKCSKTLNMNYCSFSDLQSEEDSAIVQLQQESYTIDTCTFYNLNLALQSQSTQTVIRNSYFYSIQKIILQPGTAISDTFIDPVLLSNSPSLSNIMKPVDEQVPPNFYDRFTITEHCPVGPFNPDSQEVALTVISVRISYTDKTKVYIHDSFFYNMKTENEGSCVNIKSNVGELIIETTTFYDNEGKTGGVIYTQTTNINFKEVCSNKASVIQSNNNAAFCQTSNEQSGAIIQAEQMSIIQSIGDSQASVMNTYQTSTYTGCNFSDNVELQYSVINFYKQTSGEIVTLKYDVFQRNSPNNDDSEFKVLFIDQTTEAKISDCSFIGNKYVLWMNNNYNNNDNINANIENSYFYDNDYDFLFENGSPVLTLTNCYFNKDISTSTKNGNSNNFNPNNPQIGEYSPSLFQDSLLATGLCPIEIITPARTYPENCTFDVNDRKSKLRVKYVYGMASQLLLTSI